MAYAAGYRIVIVDPKRDWMGRGKALQKFSKKGGTVDQPVLVRGFDPKQRVQIIQPYEWNEGVAQFFRDVMKYGNTIIYFDEITQLCSGTAVPKEFQVLWTQGAAIGLGAWCGTQRPRNVPMIVKDQAETWFVFRISNRDDRKAVADYMPTDDTPGLVDEPLPYHYFYYYNDSMDSPILFNPIGVNDGNAHTAVGGQYKP